MNEKVLVGISACLLGDEVRYNGGHTQSKYCKDLLSKYFRYQKFCPEMAAGFGTPRPTLRLEGQVESPRLAYTKQSGTDVSDPLIKASENFLSSQKDLCGYILMKKSPSCGMARIKVYQDNGHPSVDMRAGLFAQALMDKYPHLPVEEDGRLNDKHLRENFIMRVYAYANFKQQVWLSDQFKDILEFHSKYKYILMAHSQLYYKSLGRMLNGSYKGSFNELKAEYISAFMKAIKKPATRKNHTNVLQHLFGYLKRDLSDEAKQDILKVLEQYRNSEVNLITPLTLIHHYLKQYGSEYVNCQFYLQPYPSELGLQNSI